MRSRRLGPEKQKSDSVFQVFRDATCDVNETAGNRFRWRAGQMYTNAAVKDNFFLSFPTHTHTRGQIACCIFCFTTFTFTFENQQIRIQICVPATSVSTVSNEFIWTRQNRHNTRTYSYTNLCVWRSDDENVGTDVNSVIGRAAQTGSNTAGRMSRGKIRNLSFEERSPNRSPRPRSRAPYFHTVFVCNVHEKRLRKRRLHRRVLR